MKVKDISNNRSNC